MRPILATALFSFACGGAAAPQATVETLRAAVPGRALLSLAGSSVREADPPVVPMPASCAARGPAEFALLTHRVAHDVDGLLDSVLDTVTAIASGPPAAQAPGHATWGPLAPAGSPASYRLDVDELGPSAFHFVMAGRPAAAGEDAWRGLFQGVSAGDASSRAGDVAIDFGAMRALAPSALPAAGSVALSFSAAPHARTAFASFSGIANPGAPADDAAYRFAQSGAGASFQFATRADFDRDGILDELLRVDSQWGPGGGVAHATVSGGSLGARVVQVVECWDSSLARVFYTDDAGLHPTAGSPACCQAGRAW